MPQNLTEVVFRRPYQRYADGERAGFQPGVAHDLVNRGIAMMAPVRKESEAERYAKGQEEKFRKEVKVEVTFLKPFRMYRSGETAGFAEKYAADLVASKIAVYPKKAGDERVTPEELPEEPTNPHGEPPAKPPAEPPWGDERPTLEEFVEHYKANMGKDEILRRANVDLELGLDEKLTKAQLLEAVYTHRFGPEDDGDGSDADPVG